jgi:hypothetical protein
MRGLQIQIASTFVLPPHLFLRIAHPLAIVPMSNNFKYGRDRKSQVRDVQPPRGPSYLLVLLQDNGLCASAILYWALGFYFSSDALRKTQLDSGVLNDGILSFACVNSSQPSPPNPGFTICDVQVCDPSALKSWCSVNPHL